MKSHRWMSFYFCFEPAMYRRLQEEKKLRGGGKGKTLVLISRVGGGGEGGMGLCHCQGSFSFYFLGLSEQPMHNK